jgi:hypothetical protein
LRNASSGRDEPIASLLILATKSFYSETSPRRDYCQIGAVFVAEYQIVAAVLDLAGQDGIPALEFCAYTDDLDGIALLVVRF